MVNTKGLANRANSLHTDLIYYFDGEGLDLTNMQKELLRRKLRDLHHFLGYQLYESQSS